MDMNESSVKTGCCGSPQKTSAPVSVAGLIKPGEGAFTAVSTEWTWRDLLGEVRSRISSYRMKYRVEPGLYAVNNPGPESEVFVSANYKLSFDILRRELKGMKGWILVLDTAGINVWCAAGKGTFGTAELIKRIRLHGLDKIVSHRRVIVPQLGAPGLEAHTVTQGTGFRVVFGPVQARDIRAFVENGCTATPEMRKIRFTMADRLVLTPMEINPAMKLFLLLALALFIIFGLRPEGILFSGSFHAGLPFVILLFTAIISGTFLTPALLPFIPFRSFALKGLIVGELAIFAVWRLYGFDVQHNVALALFMFIFYPALSSHLALLFTGATTFTGISGVKKELKISLPLYIGAGVLSVILLSVYKLQEWNVL